MYTFSINTWSKNDVEAIKYKFKRWINEKDLEKALGRKNLAGTKTQYYSDEFKKRRYEDFQACRKFIAEELAIHLILDTKTVKAGQLKIKLGFNQLDPIMTKQRSIGLRLRKLFSSKEIIEDFSALNYLIDFYFPKYKLAIEFDELGPEDKDQTKENKRLKDLKEYLGCKFIRIYLGSKFIRINPDEKNSDIYDGFKKNIHIHQWVQAETKKKLLIDDLLTKLLELKFKQNNAIKSKCLKWIVKSILPKYKE